MLRKEFIAMKKIVNKPMRLLFILALCSYMVTGCTETKSAMKVQETNTEITQEQKEETQVSEEQVPSDESITEPEKNTLSQEETETEIISSEVNKEDGYYQYKGKSYRIIEVDGGDRSGTREKNVAVDIGYGDRVYWGLTNEYGQLVYVLADEIILQNDETEPVNSQGRYYNDEANVPGTERPDLDQGHVIADSLGGVSNAYNITPQDSRLNRHGDQAYMEKVIRQAGGCTNFVATITYPDTSTQIPSSYKYEYVVKGNKVVDEFPNGNPEAQTENKVQETSKPTVQSAQSTESLFDEKAELSKIDTNGNGKVTIKEAKAAGYSMPIYSDHWLYKYMDDRDGDGMVGE